MPLASFEKFNINTIPEANLSNYTTFQLGGPARAVIVCQTPEQLETVIKQFVQDDTPFILIGGGSNIVVSDQGVDCYVIRFVSETPIIEQDGNDLIVSGSTSLDALALFAAQNGLEGLNYTSGIPGTVGGAIVGNAGAFGKQVGDVMDSAILLSRSGIQKQVQPDALDFKYRYSNLRESGDIVLSVRFKLQQSDQNALLREREEILATRREKHPNLDVHPCAGSFFRNIEPTSKAGKRQATGWFLDQAGGRELKYGGAKIFDKHANIIIKSTDCKAQDVYELSKQMAQLAKDKFDLELVREVKFVGNFDGRPKDINSVIW